MAHEAIQVTELPFFVVFTSFLDFYSIEVDLTLSQFIVLSFNIEAGASCACNNKEAYSRNEHWKENPPARKRSWLTDALDWFCHIDALLTLWAASPRQWIALIVVAASNELIWYYI